jgi:hypothetical protein
MRAVPDLQRELPYAGLRVGRLWLDQGCALELHPRSLSSDDGAVIRLLRHPFRLRERDGTEHLLTPHEHKTLLPLFSLLGTHVIAARVTSEGDLDLRFENGAELQASELEEGWEYLDPWTWGKAPG